MKIAHIIRNFLFIVVLSSLVACNFTDSGQRKIHKEAKKLLEEEDYAKAIEKFDEALMLRDKNKVKDIDKEILKDRAEAEFKLGDYEAAKYSYELLLQIGETEDKAQLKSLILICLSRTEGKLLEAKQVFDELNNLKATGKTYEFALSEFAAALSKKQKSAYKQIDEAGENEENNEKDSDENIYKLFLNLEDIKAVYEKYYESNKKASISNSLGILELTGGNYEKALEYYNTAKKELEKEDEKEQKYALEKALAFNKAVVYEYLGQYEEAINLFKQYMYTYGETKSVQHEITFLKTRLR